MMIFYPKYEVIIWNYRWDLVLDNGPGIGEEVMLKIFDPYFSHLKQGGTGIGLDFCRKVMVEFGGGIICESEVGKWTRFTLLFPIVEFDVDSLVD